MKLGEGMDGQVGLLEKPKTGHPPRIRKLVPDTVAQGFQIHPGNDALKEAGQGFPVAQRFLWTPINFQQPFNACQKGVPLSPVGKASNVLIEGPGAGLKPAPTQDDAVPDRWPKIIGRILTDPT